MDERRARDTQGADRRTFDESRAFGPPRGAYDADRGFAEARYPGGRDRDFGDRRRGADPFRREDRETWRYWDGYDFGPSPEVAAWDAPEARNPSSARQRYGRDADSYARPGADRERRSFWDRMSDEAASWFGDRYARERRDEDHSGRGPRGYRRADERINDDVHDRLTDDPHLDASDIVVAVESGEVTLGGLVRSRHDKHRAEHLVERVLGVTHVQNNLRVGAAPGEGVNSVLDDQAAGRR